MVTNLFNLCKAGGRAAGMGSSPKIPADKLLLNAKYGRTYTLEDDYFKVNGSRYTIRIVDQEHDVDIPLVLYWYSPEHYEQVFKKVGFTDFRWVDMTMTGDEGNEAYWRDFLEYNTLIMFEAFKAL